MSGDVARADDLHADPLASLQQLAPLDERAEQHVAERAVFEQQVAQIFAVDLDVAHRRVATALRNTVWPESRLSSPRNPYGPWRTISSPAASMIAASPSRIAMNG